MGTEHEARGGELFPTLAERGEAKFTAARSMLPYVILLTFIRYGYRPRCMTVVL